MNGQQPTGDEVRLSGSRRTGSRTTLSGFIASAVTVSALLAPGAGAAAPEKAIALGGGVSYAGVRAPLARSGAAAAVAADLALGLGPRSAARLRYDASVLRSEILHAVWLLADLRPWRRAGLLGGAALSARALAQTGAGLGAGAYYERPLAPCWAARVEVFASGELQPDTVVGRVRAVLLAVHSW